MQYYKYIKRIIVMLICMWILLGISSAFAYNYPSSFWDVNSKYENALNTNNYSDIITYGIKEIDMFKSVGDCSEKRNILITRYNQVGIAYANLKNYDESCRWFSLLYDYAKYYDEFNEYTRSAKQRIKQYSNYMDVYTDNGASTNYKAKNEKANGVLFGLCSNGETRKKLDNESLVLTYQEFGQSLIAYNIDVVSKAAKQGQAIEFALNCPKKASDIKNTRNMTTYLKEISDLFKKYPDTPIYLRFAGEFNVWENPATPEEFISAFRYVSDYFKGRNSNVAMVWSPNQVSSWNINLDDYYPGDSYVDWVGISLYSQKYFMGDKNQSDEYQLIFQTGINSDPVLAIKDIVEEYGDRKPIIISESGCGHKLVNSGENTSSFAIRRLKESMYYIPIVYPQVKAMAYFDWYVNSAGENYDYRLSTNTNLQNEYIKAVGSTRFVQDKYSDNVDVCYRKVTDGITVGSVFPVACYAHKYNTDLKSVIYYIDDKYVAVSYNLPFETLLDATAYNGLHTLKTVAEFSDGSTLSVNKKIYINNNSSDIKVEISGDTVSFDQKPIIYNSRTMVPMRKIFEELGATVSWNNDTQMVVGKRGDRTVKMTIGSKKMYINSKEVNLDTAPIILGGRTLAPVRAVAEGLGCNVDWNERYRVVEIEPKVFEWSSWVTELPSDVDNDLFYIEEKTEYRTRTRDKEYITYDYDRGYGYDKYVRTDISYGNWSDWQNDYISSNDSREVETRTESSPKRYHYAHYCTGYNQDVSLRYKTANYRFSDLCDYHDLGWYDYQLSDAPDGNGGYVIFSDDGSVSRCSNTCYRYYLIETTGGDYTQYRYRDITKKYIYWQWGEYGNWSDWSDDYCGYDDYTDVDKRTIYRYKEK